jgi:hypothetical protein
MAPAAPLRLSPTSPEYKGISQLNIIYEAGKVPPVCPIFYIRLDFSPSSLGLDSESRPILILCANNLPNTDTINYDLILA